ncbi:MAG: flagellar biosynthesis anti-sigma factor FlgM [Planctomycetota bacterium]
MQVSGSSQVHQAHALQGPHATRSRAAGGAEQAKLAQPVDQLEISAEAAQASQAGGVRTDRVAEIRAQIASGAYETPEKLDAAVERLLDQIG